MKRMNDYMFSNNKIKKKFLKIEQETFRGPFVTKRSNDIREKRGELMIILEVCTSCEEREKGAQVETRKSSMPLANSSALVFTSTTSSAVSVSN